MEIVDLAADLDRLLEPLTMGASATAEIRRSILEIFQIRTPWAPGLSFVGALLRLPDDAARLSVGGTGLAVVEAIESCLGEAIERFSMVDDGSRGAPSSEVATHGLRDLRDWAERNSRRDEPEKEGPGEFLQAQHLGSDRPSLLAVDLCLRRPPSRRVLTPLFALSTGCAAGASRAQALKGAIYELIERDAASMWWMGGVRGRMVAPHEGVVGRLIGRLRRGARHRFTHLLDITSDLAIPCVAALSFDPDGRGLACGLSARGTFEAAARSAILEMCQMEISLALTRDKALRGASLSMKENEQLRRAALIDVDACLSPGSTEGASRQNPIVAASDEDEVDCLVARLSGHGVDLHAVNLTKEKLGIPVWRVIAPMLQLMPSEVISPRLTKVIESSGGGIGHRHNLPLM